MSKRKIRRIVLEALAAALLIFALVFFLGFKVTGVEVKGNKFYSDSQIKKMVLDAPIAGNSILALWINTEEKTKDAQMIDHVTLKRKNRNTLVVQVKEKQMVGCIQFEGQYINFDRQGIIQIITEEPLEDVPLIDGLDVKEAKQGEKLKGINTRKLNTILSVGKMLEKSEQKPDRLVFSDLNQLILYYGDIEVRMGDDENMDEKMNRLTGILPELEGMKGILHMENVTEDTESIVFDQEKDPEEEDLKEGEDQDLIEDSEEAGSGGENAGSEEEDLRESEGEDLEAEDSDPERELEEEDTDLDYSDGEDAADTGSRSQRREE